jgi:hypothetical protein
VEDGRVDVGRRDGTLRGIAAGAVGGADDLNMSKVTGTVKTITLYGS